MCSRYNLQLFTRFMVCMKVLLFAALMSIGSIFVSDTDLERAYGDSIVRHGAGLLFVGSAVPISQYVGLSGGDNHNTFLLLLHSMFEGTLFAVQFSISSDVLAMSQDEYPPALREDCLRVVPGEYDAKACAEYIDSDRYSGIHLVWAYTYDKAQYDSDSYSKIDGFQKTGDCCGFAAPVSCEPDSRTPPEDRLTEDVTKTFRDERQTCGSESGWYPISGEQNYECSQAIDPDAPTPVIGGCKYEMPLGACKDYDPDAGTQGCASTIEAAMNLSLNIQGAVIFILTTFQLLSILAACCLCCKRKATDVLPAHLEAEPPEPYPVQKKKKPGDPPGIEVASAMVGSDEQKWKFTPELEKEKPTSP
mmetsp:Transcript_69677/g.136987  ORF Transcript_69677/g.136987 Transcript_69677/m.136987 type:complete len:362 (+) Transcript_69677:131-1216(+)